MKSYIEQVMEAHPTWPRRVLHGEYVGILSGVQPLLGGEAAPLYRFPGGECMGSGSEQVVRTMPIDEGGEVKCGCCGGVLLCNIYGDMPEICPCCHEGVDWSPWEDK